jgi:DNA-directed RNA polymerase specialized sigma24 family protein
MGSRLIARLIGETLDTEYRECLDCGKKYRVTTSERIRLHQKDFNKARRYVTYCPKCRKKPMLTMEKQSALAQGRVVDQELADMDDDTEQEIVRLYTEEGKGAFEISRKMGLSYNTVSTLLGRKGLL